MTTLSLCTRLTLWYTLALVVVLGLFGADVLWVQSGIGVRRVDRELDGLTTTITTCETPGIFMRCLASVGNCTVWSKCRAEG